MNKVQPVSAPSVPPGLDPERAARMLDRFAEMALEQAEAMHQATLAAAEAGDPAAAKAFSAIFDHAGRNLRRSLALQARLAREQQEATEKKAVAARARAEEKTRRCHQVARAVACSIGSDDGIDAEKGGALVADIWERLVEDEDLDAELALPDHPIEEAGPPGWPLDGPDAGRYWRFVEPGWYDLDTCKKLNRPPWELKLGRG